MLVFRASYNSRPIMWDRQSEGSTTAGKQSLLKILIIYSVFLFNLTEYVRGNFLPCSRLLWPLQAISGGEISGLNVFYTMIENGCLTKHCQVGDNNLRLGGFCSRSIFLSFSEWQITWFCWLDTNPYRANRNRSAANGSSERACGWKDICN